MYDPRAAQIAPFCVADAVLRWYDRSGRDLPWRARPPKSADPYAVWISEIMLQQTTVAAATPYFKAFLERWPNVSALAAAPLADVMRQWAGLGYYSRARNLYACATTVAAEFKGRFPRTVAELRRLPGIGPYTAAAIAAIAYGQRAVVVDGNVERVVARFFALETPLPAAKARIREKADELTPPERAGDFAQGMMDLGATICAPRNPACAICPLTGACAGQRSGEPVRFPLKAPRAARPRRRGAAFFIKREDGAVLLRTRPPKGLLGGMTELPGTAWTADFELAGALAQAPLAATYRKLEAAVEHGFTHFSLRLDIYTAIADLATEAPRDCRWVDEAGLADEPLPGLMRKIFDAVARRGDFKVCRAKPLASRAAMVKGSPSRTRLNSDAKAEI